jgi:hypothetical protein
VNAKKEKKKKKKKKTEYRWFGYTSPTQRYPPAVTKHAPGISHHLGTAGIPPHFSHSFAKID